jgi:hypothetical protein
MQAQTATIEMVTSLTTEVVKGAIFGRTDATAVSPE